MLLLKALVVNLYWFIAVFYGSRMPVFGVLFFVTALLVTNYKLYFKEPFLKYFLTTFLLGLLGRILDEILLGLGSFSFVGTEAGYPFWMWSLYFVFVLYFGDIFNFLAKQRFLVQFVVGAIGGLLAYVGGEKLGAIKLAQGIEIYLLIALLWGGYFTLMMHFYYSQKLWNKVLDTTIFYSFDRSGFKRHARLFKNDFKQPYTGNALVTGGTSGIGLALSKSLAEKGVAVTVTGRSEEKGAKVASKNNLIHFMQLDLSDWGAIDSFVNDLSDPIDFLVLNAGGMPTSFQTNKHGIELQMASQLFGHYYLLKWLYKLGLLKKEARVVWVSSGGMYLRKLTLDEIFKNESYDKVATYANVKRSQVELMDFFAKEFSDLNIVAMHPGWVKTPGLEDAISGFAKKMNQRLRTPEEGADTILWILLKKQAEPSGGFYFDRQSVGTHFMPWTKSDDGIVKKLYDILNDLFNKLAKNS